MDNTFRMDRLRYKILVAAGYYKLHTKNHYLREFHKVYRIVVIFFLMLITAQSATYLYQLLPNASENSQLFYNVLVSTLLYLKLLITVIGLNFRSKYIAEVYMILQDPMFRGSCKKDKDYLKAQDNRIHFILKLTLMAITGTTTLYNILQILNKVKDSSTTAGTYYPFDTSTWSGYCIALMWNAMTFLWTTYGYIMIDCSVACYFIRASTQLKIMNYRLEHIFDDNHDHISKSFQYKDVADPRFREEFINCIHHYDKVYRLVESVMGAFKEGIAYHILNIIATTGIFLYRMSDIAPSSFEFIFIFQLMFIFQLENYMYCFFGQQLENESMRLSTSIYYSDWLAVSPRMRRMMLIAMARWARPISPTIYIVPLSLSTFESIVRTSYTFYTMMKTTND